jgi:hypothetical protein
MASQFGCAKIADSISVMASVTFTRLVFSLTHLGTKTNWLSIFITTKRSCGDTISEIDEVLFELAPKAAQQIVC